MSNPCSNNHQHAYNIYHQHAKYTESGDGNKWDPATYKTEVKLLELLSAAEGSPLYLDNYIMKWAHKSVIVNNHQFQHKPNKRETVICNLSAQHGLQKIFPKQNPITLPGSGEVAKIVVHDYPKWFIWYYLICFLCKMIISFFTTKILLRGPLFWMTNTCMAILTQGTCTERTLSCLWK